MNITLHMLACRLDTIRREINDDNDISKELEIQLNSATFKLTSDNFIIDDDGTIIVNVSHPSETPATADGYSADIDAAKLWRYYEEFVKSHGADGITELVVQRDDLRDVCVSLIAELESVEYENDPPQRVVDMLKLAKLSLPLAQD